MITTNIISPKERAQIDDAAALVARAETFIRRRAEIEAEYQALLASPNSYELSPKTVNALTVASAAVTVAAALEKPLHAELATATIAVRQIENNASSRVTNAQSEVGRTIEAFVIAKLPPEVGTALDAKQAPLYAQEMKARINIPPQEGWFALQGAAIPQLIAATKHALGNLKLIDAELGRCAAAFKRYGGKVAA